MTNRQAIVASTVLVFSLFVALLVAHSFTSRPDAAEIFAQSVNGDTPFIDAVAKYRTLLASIGAERAQDVLITTMPSDAKSHMLDHETGRFLYDSEGTGGITGCKPYFAGACYHGFLIEMMSARGTGDVGNLFAECLKGLSNEQALDCAHGIGHAFLAVEGYVHLPKALSDCAAQFKAPAERTNCYNGVFMENSFGAFNVPPANRWFTADDPMYPCNTAQVLKYAGAHSACWFMQSQMTLNKYAYPNLSGDMRAVETYCDTLRDADDRDTCLRSIGLQVQHINGNDPAKIRTACGELSPSRATQCLWDAGGSAYYFGDRAADSWELHMCEADTLHKDDCYRSLFTYLAYSYSYSSDRTAACASLPESKYRTECVMWMQSPAVDKALGFGTFK